MLAKPSIRMMGFEGFQPRCIWYQMIALKLTKCAFQDSILVRNSGIQAGILLRNVKVDAVKCYHFQE